MHILIATDGSEFSFAATRRCCQLFNSNIFTKIKIIYVEEEISDSIFSSLSSDYIEIMNKALQTIAEEIIDQTKNEIVQILGKTKCHIETQILNGKPKKVIIEEAESCEAELIVVGSHGRGFWKRTLLGSVSTAVVKHARCSVFIGR